MKIKHFVCSTAALLGSFTLTAANAQELTLNPSPVPYQSQLDPQMLQVLQVLETIAGTPIINLRPIDARQQFSAEDAAKILARASGKQEVAMPVSTVVDTYIPGPDATSLPIRIYTPTGHGPFPVILYFHGGGFVIATIDTYDASARALANLTKAVVVSVEYRKAPQHPFPAAVDDATQAYKWLLANASSIEGDNDRIAVAGESAGGELATDVCLYARDAGIKPPVYQLLVYPVVSTNINLPSSLTYANAIPLSRPALTWFYEHYLQGATDYLSPYVTPLTANLRGLPPATVISAQIDPLQSEGEMYAAKLNAAQVKTHYLLYTGVTHEFFGMGAVVDKAKAAEAAAATNLLAAFAK